jgi:hypothetical protein
MACLSDVLAFNLYLTSRDRAAATAAAGGGYRGAAPAFEGQSILQLLLFSLQGKAK